MADQAEIDALRKRRDNAQRRLIETVEGSCLGVLGGGHQPRQHRDGKPPWCGACGRTADGLLARGARS